MSGLVSFSPVGILHVTTEFFKIFKEFFNPEFSYHHMKMFSFLNRHVHVSRSRWRKKYVFKKPSYTPNWLINRGSVLSYKEKHKIGGSAANFKGQYIGNKKRNYLSAPTIKPTFKFRFTYYDCYIHSPKISNVGKRNRCAKLKFRPEFLVLPFLKRVKWNFYFCIINTCIISIFDFQSHCCGYGSDGRGMKGYDCIIIPNATKVVTMVFEFLRQSRFLEISLGFLRLFIPWKLQPNYFKKQRFSSSFLLTWS